MPLINQITGDPNIVQTMNSVLSVDKTTTSTTYSTLHSISLTTEGSTNVLLWISYCVTFTPAVSNDCRLRLNIDGYSVLYAGEEEFTAAQSGSIVYRAASMSAATHTFTIQWRRGAGDAGTLRCRPSVPPEGLSIIAMEVRV